MDNFERNFLYNNFGCNSICNRRCSSCAFHREYIIEIYKKMNSIYNIENYYSNHSALETARYLCSIYNTDYFTNNKIMRIMSYCGVRTHSIKDANRMSSTKAQREKTNIERFGAVNPLSRGTLAFEKRNNTVKEKYGVDNVFQAKEIKEKIVKTTFEHFGCYCQADPDVYSKTKKTMLDKYGCWSYHTEAARLKNLESQKGNAHWVSKPDKIVQKFLLDNNIFFEEEKTFFNKNEHRWAIVDIVVGNTAFEVQGTYWHADPRVYKENDIVYHEKTAKDIWMRDASKKLFLESFGLKVIYLWQSDINDNFETIKKIILENI